MREPLARDTLVVRGAFAALAYVAPTFTVRIFGLRPEENRTHPYYTRVFGARDMAIAALGLSARGEARRNVLLACTAIDLLDIVSALLGRRDQHLTPRAIASLTALAAAGLVPDALAAGRRT